MMSEQINGFQAKVQEQFKDAQAKASTRAKEIEAEARKAFAALSEKAQETSRESLFVLGGELIKLGKRLQEIGKAAEPKAAEADIKAQA